MLPPLRRPRNAGCSTLCAVSSLGNLPRSGTGGGDGFSLPPAQSAGGSIDRLRDYLNVDAALASRGGSHHKARLTDLRRPPRRQLLRRLRRPNRRRLRRLRRRTA